MSDMDFSLDGLDLDMGEAEVDTVRLEADVQNVTSLLGLGDLDLLPDDTLGYGMDIDDGSNIILDFGAENEGMDASTLLRTESDLSKDFLDYSNYVVNARQKIMATATPVEAKRTMPTFADFSFISSAQERQLVFGFFCAMLADLTTEEKYLDLTQEQAYKLLLEEMFNELHYTPNVHADKFERIFNAYYERNKRIAMAQSVDLGDTLASLISLERLEQAELVYSINSIPFNVVTHYFNDPSVINTRLTIKASDYGDLAQLIKKQKGGGSITHQDIYDFIGSFLMSEDTRNLLKLTEDQQLEFSFGELLRRFILQELNEGDFFPSGMEKLCSTSYTLDLLRQLYASLVNGIQRQSFAAELLCLILELMNGSANMKNSGDTSYIASYTVGISQYLSAFIKDHALVNPVFYTYIGYTEEGNNQKGFELGYAQGERSLSVHSSDILCEVIGDNSNVYHIPLVYVDKSTTGTICPPVEVVEGVRKLAPSGKISIGGNICYRCEPTFAWMSSLSLASSAGPKEEQSSSEGIGRGNNPLLDVLLRYHNKFDMSGNQPEVLSISAPGKCTILGIREGAKDSVRICQLLNDSGRKLQLDSGSCLLDDDGGLIVRYIDSTVLGEQVMVLDNQDYEATVIDGGDSAGDESTIPMETIIHGFTPDKLTVEAGAESYYRAVAQRVCELNALDYQSELELARQVLRRDLSKVIRFSAIDELLGATLAKFYADTLSADTMGSFNLGTLKELWGFTYGEPNAVTGKKQMTPEDFEAFTKEVEEYISSEAYTNAMADDIDLVKSHLLGLQICSRSELCQDVDSSLYNAMHYLPRFNRQLSIMENQMVLIHALREIDEDIATILRKSSPAFSCYNTITTKETVVRMEANLKSGMKDKDIPPCLHITKDILFSDLAENYAVVKYFVLEQNLYGVLTELEECFAKGDVRYKELYDELRSVECPNLSGDTLVGSVTEEDFRELSEGKGSDVLTAMHEKLLGLVFDGLVAEASANINLQVIKAYDILTGYGRLIFNLNKESMQDFTDTSEFRDAFFSYVGSFYLTYCPVMGEAADEIDGGYDRYTAYLRNRKDFKTPFELTKLEGYQLKDLKLVAGLESGETLAARSGKDDVDPADL